MAFFIVDQLRRAGDVGDGLAGWWVTLPDLPYRGRAVAPAAWTPEQVVDGLERRAGRCGYPVLAGRLYSRTRVDGGA